MPFVTRTSLWGLAVFAGVGALVAGAVWSGVYNVGADDEHTAPVLALMNVVRERSIEARAAKLEVPDLRDPARALQGAGNYDAMCTGCHLTPGAGPTEISKGLYPAPPNLSKRQVDAAEAFWIIKHGVKASGMPAWGKSMDDQYIWNMVAFLQQLPKLDARQYHEMVQRSGGHSHGGGERDGHMHAEGEAAHSDAMEEPAQSRADEHEAHDAHEAHEAAQADAPVPAHGQPGHHH